MTTKYNLDIEMNKETKEWLDYFKVSRGLSTREEAIELIVEQWKVWHNNDKR